MNIKKALAGAVLAIGMCVSAANAAIYTDTLGEFNYDGGPAFPSPEQNVGSFLFSIGPGETIVSATVSGTFGNSSNASSAPMDVFGDGDLLGQCVINTACYFAGPTVFSFAVTALSDLLDGIYILSIIQTSEAITRLGQTTLTINTRPSDVPVPAALPLLAAALGGLGFAGWRRKHKAAQAA